MPTSCRRVSCRRSFDFKNYATVLASRVPFLQIYANSLLVAVVVTIGQLVTCTLAAFAFARLNFRGRDALFFILLVGLMFPAQVTILPIYLGYAQLGLINRPIGLALMYLTSSFGVFLMRQFMLSQPKELEEAALMDAPAISRSSGASRCRNCGRRFRRSASSPSPRPGTTISRRACCSARNRR